MANSKANIYPVQLQGAQLNLNKYNAEIKQYSGFNKNNAPFVGGCLANVFTKDEHLDAATESMYIDINGDIYTVDETGLYKNEDILFSFPGNSKFWGVKKIDVPANTLFVFSEKIIFTLKNNYGYINGQIVWTNFEGVEDINDILTRRCTGTFINENTFVFVGEYIFNNTKYFKVSFFTKEGVFIGAETFHPTSGVGNIGETIAIIKPTEDSSGLCIMTTNNWLYLNYNLENFSVTLQGQSSGNTNFHMASGYANTQNINYCIPINYPINKVYLFRTSGQTITASSDCYHVIEITGLYSTNVLNAKGVESTVMTTLTSDAFNVYFKYFKEKCSYTPHSCCIDFYVSGTIYPINGDSFPLHIASGKEDYMNRWGFSVELYDNKNINVFQGGSTAFQNEDLTIALLFNNNQFSGIAGKYCLFTDWNTVPHNSVFVNGNKAYYKQGGEWYVLYTTSPKIKKINNQLVVNIDYYNSWDIKQNKQLLFAPSFNLTLGVEDDPATEAFFRNNAATPNTKYIAAARSEYNLEQNPSILLNPISVKNLPNTYKIINKYPYFFDVYTGENLNSLVYITTLRWKSETLFDSVGNADLIGLPFPITTDGNVQYSPCLFSEIESQFGNQAFIKSGNASYPLAMGNNSEPIMSYFLASGVENLDKGFIIQGQFYGLLNNGIYSLNFSNGVINDIHFIVDIANMQFVGNTPYMAIFFSKTNRCLYGFTGANLLNTLQFVDKVSEIRVYGYNPTTQTNILITDIGVIMLSTFGSFLLEYTDVIGFYLQDNGICLYNNNGDYHFIKYYKEENDGYTKQNITLETCFYGMDNQRVTINDCLYMRLFSEEHEAGELEVSATTLSNSGRITEKTTFKIKSSDWDAVTHSIYLRYQPKEQRGLGVSFSINSPFKIAALSIGSIPDAILVDKVSKGAINAPERTTNNNEW